MNPTPQKIYCDICRKSFSTKNQFLQHERSKRHLKGLQKAQEEFQNAEVVAEERGVIVEEKEVIAEQKEATSEETVTTEQKEAITEEQKESSPEEKNTEPNPLNFQPEDYTFDPDRCIFCGFISASTDAYSIEPLLTPSNLLHMTQKHGFILPDKDCIIDLEGLLDYLGQKVRMHAFAHR